MTNYKAGSVTAEIVLDTKQFNEAIGKLKEEIASLKTTFNDIKGSSSFAETIQALKKEVDSLKEKNKELIDNNKKLNKSFKDVGKNVKSEINYLKNLSPELQKSINNVNNFVKANETLSKSAEQSTKSTLKETEAVTKLNMAQREAGLTAKRNSRIYNNMRLEASNYINGLKRGRHAKGVIGTDSALWANFEGIDGRTKTFDYDRFVNHMKKTFKDIIPDDVFKDMFHKLQKQYEIGLAGWTLDRGGISEKGFERLTSSAKYVEDIKGYNKRKQSKSRRKLNELLGIGGKDYYEWQIEAASKAFAVLERQIKSTKINLRELSSVGKPFDATIKEIERASKAFQLFEIESNPQKFLQNWSNATLTFKRSAEEIEAALNKIITLERKGYVPTGADKFKQYSYNHETTIKELEQATKGFQTLERRLKSTEINLKGFNEIYSSLGKSIYSNNGYLQQALQMYKSLDYGVEGHKARLQELSVQTKKTFETMQVELAKANAAQYKYWQQSRGSVSGFAEPLPIKGYNDYLKAIKEINQGLVEFKRNQQEVNKVAKYTDDEFKVAGQALARMNTELEKEVRTIRLANRQLQLWHKYHRIDRGTYISNMSNINAKLEEQTANLKKNNAELRQNDINVRKAGRGLTSFNNGVVQTAHSGRILSNTLYQIRGALLSLKMIFTAMGGMMLWGFAMDLAESVKETVTAKNEMEAQLKQRFTNQKTGVVDTASIQYFRKELDKLPSTFKKVNKYSIGETVSSIGLEFDLTAKQMKDALPIVTMIQSEYVRAGRKNEEAALAVKDILQGEFQRLSRETGIGKEELIAFGWDEDKENIDGLLKALEKAGLARHWDTFAKKATSLNDVVTITKSRFSELGAELMDSVTPLIVGAFNAITDGIEGLQRAFGGLDVFWQNIAIFGGGVGLFGGILTALPMVTKGMGLAEIATLGWNKSVLTAVLNLNKAEVAQYGFGKALAAVITGTKASELSTIRSSKAILGRLLGVKQSTLAEHGFMSALVESKALLKGHSQVAISAAAGMGTLQQKIIYLAKGEIVADQATATWGKTIKSVITSTRLWRMAILGITSIGLVAWLSSVAMWTDTVKKRVEAYNDILAEGDTRISEAKDTVTAYTNRQSKLKSELDGLTKGTDEYNKKLEELNLTTSNLNTAKHNVADLESAKKLADSVKKTTEETAKSNDLMLNRGLNDIYSANGVKNVEQYGKEYQKMKYVAYDLQHAEEERYKFEYASLQHINEHVEQLKQAGVEEKDRIKYITEYSTKAEEAAQHLKEFNQGDLTSGLYYLLDRISLAWIDLWNDQHFLNFWKSVQKTWSDLKPTVDGLVKSLGDLGHLLLDFFATKQGQIIGGIALAGATFGVLAWKLGGVVGTLKDTYNNLKPLKDKLSDIGKGWKDAGDKAEEATKKMGGTTSTGGITGETSNTSLGADLKGIGKNRVKSFANNALMVAEAMMLITEAILLLNVAMGALAVTGEVFKRIEPQVRKGIEGLKLIAPTVIALMVPTIALMVIMDKFKVTTSQLTQGFKSSAVGIALAITLVTEAIVLLNAPLLGLAILGSVYGGIKNNVKQGIEAIKVTNEALRALVPWVPIFIGGIVLASIAFGSGGVGGIAILAVALGIGIGIGLVTEAIVAMSLPLEALGEVGANFPDLSNVKQGAEALKVTAEALGYVEEGMRAFTAIKFEELGSLIADVIGMDLGVDLTKLSGEGGFFEQLKTFTEEFNKLELTPIDTGKVTTLSESATGLDSVKKALVTVKDALKDLPNFEVDNRSINQKYQDNVSGQKTTDGISNYFEQLKQPIEQLNTFIKNFNDLEIVGVESGQVELIQGSANAIGAINSAIENVKTAMGNVVDAQWSANMSTGGIVGAVVGFVAGDGNPNASGLKAGLDELYNSVKDIMDFNTKIAGLTSEGSGDTSSIQGASNMVSALQTEINNLKTTLSTAIPTIKATAKDMGSSIVTGVKEGISTLSTVANDAKTQGENIATKINDGFKDKFDIKSPTQTEIDDTLKYLDGKKDEFYDKGEALGKALSEGYKNGQDMHSPGIIARSTREELDRVGGYFDDALINLPQKAFNLAQSVASNMGGMFSGAGIQLPNMDAFNQTLSQVVPTVNNVKTQVSTNFSQMQTNIGNSFNGIVGKTKTSLSNMQSQTTKNITGIKTSWKGMQTALIASAENIRQQTGQKINTLKDNMASFWRKIKNPELLISGSAGGHTGTIKRRFGSSTPRMHYAGGGGTISRSQKLFPSVTRSNRSPDDDIGEYLKCLLEKGKPCYAGGWDFNWSHNIQNRLTGWKTHFGKYHLDDFLNVGKFSNSSFPVRGRADVAKQYIFDVISSTRYSKYFDSNFGDDPVAALRAGAFNCWDGTNIVLALARAFGFSGSRMHGTWNGIGHVWASIPGLGVIDPTAIQNRGTFMATGAVNYGGGTKAPLKSSDVNTGEVHNYNGDINITINTDGRYVEVDENKIDDRSARQILDILGISPTTGR